MLLKLSSKALEFSLNMKFSAQNISLTYYFVPQKQDICSLSDENMTYIEPLHDI